MDISLADLISHPLPPDHAADHGRDFGVQEPRQAADAAASTKEAKYLHRQLMLLREDFLQPLRQSVRKLLQHDVDTRETQMDELRLVGVASLGRRILARSSLVHPLNVVEDLGVLDVLPGSLILLRPAHTFAATDDAAAAAPVPSSVSNLLIGILHSSPPPPLQSATPAAATPAAAVQLIDGRASSGSGTYLVYGYNVYYPAYQHTAAAMGNLARVSFSRYIVDGETSEIGIPEYFEVDPTIGLQSSLRKMKPGTQVTDRGRPPRTVQEVYQSLREKQELGQPKEKIPLARVSEDLIRAGGLNPSQAEAIQSALSRELALIQGPPGTGKSLVGCRLINILLENRISWAKKSSSSGKKMPSPILVICLTNSALDELLEAVVESVSPRLIRLGSQSTSNSIRPHTLTSILQYLRESMIRTQSIYHQEKELLAQLDLLKSELEDESGEAGVGDEKDEDGIDADDDGSAESFTSKLKDLTEKLERLHVIERSMIGRGCDVVGATVTGAAMYKSLLEELRPRVVIVDEAAEILESQLIASLPTSCLHLVMIGDHLQLRPQVASHELNMTEAHGVSLFERLITQGLPFSRLQTQHRMVPEISRLLRPLYPDLQDHPCVRARRRILHNNVYFLDHDQQESRDKCGSITNMAEARLAVGLAAHLVHRGVVPTTHNVTILTPYAAQLRLIRSLKPPSGCIQDTVDNYQGKENTAVILSLVRGGSSSIGFLASPNRVCVALSRARDILFIIGNMRQLKSKSQFWFNLNSIFLEMDALGESLPWECSTHPGTITQIQQSCDLDRLEGGGCELACRVSLSCRHTCRLKCHAVSVRHVCGQACQRACRNEHPCSKACGEPCGECEIRVVVELGCGHEVEVPCHTSGRTDLMRCPETRHFKLGCGHSVNLPCDSHTASATKTTTATTTTTTTVCCEPCPAVLDCGHRCQLNCHVDKPGSAHLCSEFCPLTCDRGHPCPGLCGQPCPPCATQIEVQLDCSHFTRIVCSEDVRNFECTQKCLKTLGCGHICRALCYETCNDVCRFRGLLELACGHKVSGRCSDRPSCDQPCSLYLDCGHACQAGCGQPCQKRCQVLVEVEGSGGGLCSHSSRRHQRPCHEVHHVDGGDDAASGAVSECSSVCGVELSCGHPCPGTCHECTSSGFHAACTATCSRRLVCGHDCPAACGQLCPTCNFKSIVRCPHSKASVKCGEEAKPCKEKCGWRCAHKKCTKKCGSPCNREVCDERCEKRLDCGHRCAAPCGELCICADCAPPLPAAERVPNDSGCNTPPPPAAAAVGFSFPVFNLGCGCRNSYQAVIQHNREKVGLLECPWCGRAVQFSHPFKQAMERNLCRVLGLTDLFFTRSLKIKERTDALITKLQSLSGSFQWQTATDAEESAAEVAAGVAGAAAGVAAAQMVAELEHYCANSLDILQSGSKKLMGSTQLSMLELKTEMLGLLLPSADVASNRDLDQVVHEGRVQGIHKGLVKGVLRQQNVNLATIRELRGRLLAKLDDISRPQADQLDQLLVYSYQAGLWRECADCATFYQVRCPSCKTTTATDESR